MAEAKGGDAPSEEETHRQVEAALEEEDRWQGDDRDPAWVAAREQVPAARAAIEALMEAEMSEEERGEAPALGDTDIVRFLVAREGDVDKAAELCVSAQKWALEVRPHDVDEASHEAELRMNKTFVDGTDLHGHPVMWFDASKHITSECTDETRLKHGVYLFQTLVDRTRPEDNVHQFVIVEDVANFGYRNHDRASVKILVDVLNRGMAERMHRAYVINTGWMFWVFWKVISVFVPKRTRDKIVFCRNEAEWQAVIDAQFDPAVVPRAFGGKCEWEYEYVPGVQVAVRGDPAAVEAAKQRAREADDYDGRYDKSDDDDDE